MKLKQILRNFQSHKILWHMSKMKGLICKLVWWLIIQLCHVVALSWINHFIALCFKHALSKVCKYAISNDKVAHMLCYASIKSTYSNIQKCITWPIFLTKGNWHGKKYVWNLVWTPTNWICWWRQITFQICSLMSIMKKHLHQNHIAL